MEDKIVMKNAQGGIQEFDGIREVKMRRPDGSLVSFYRGTEGGTGSSDTQTVWIKQTETATGAVDVEMFDYAVEGAEEKLIVKVEEGNGINLYIINK